MNKYYGNFSDRESVALEFGCFARTGDAWKYSNPPPEVAPDFPTDDEILFAWYEYEDYSGSAMVLFQRDGKLYEVCGGHCSCDGLEDQWRPGEVTWDALAMRGYEDPEQYCSYGPPAASEARDHLVALVAQFATPPAKA